MFTVSDRPHQLHIRPIEPRDAAEACALIEQLGYQRPVHEVAAWIETLPARVGYQAAFVACLDEQLVGWIEISLEHRLQSPPYALIGGLVVKDGYRNQRFGLRLCEHAENWTWQRGIPVLRVTSRSTRPDAHRFYLRNGYQTTKISHVFEKLRPANLP
jgi:GNAT superfamily N-acetyltransferase